MIIVESLTEEIGQISCIDISVAIESMWVPVVGWFS